jgi:hypothetical protein
MNDLFSPVNVNPNITFILSIVGIFLGLWSITRQKTSYKSLSVLQADNEKIDSHIKELDKKLILGVNKNKLFKATIFIKNSGNEVLKLQDLYSRPTLYFSTKIKPIKIRVERTNKFSNIEIIREKDGLFGVEFDIAEPKDIIKLIIYYQCEEKPKIFFESNIIHGSRNNTELSKYFTYDFLQGAKMDMFGSEFIVSIILFAVISVVEVFIIEQSLGIQIIKSNMGIVLPLGWFALILLSPLTISIIFCKKLLNKKIFYWNKIKNWYEMPE